MRGLTLKRPWAACFVRDVPCMMERKRVENRGWKPPGFVEVSGTSGLYVKDDGLWLLLHEGSGVDKVGVEMVGNLSLGGGVFASARVRFVVDRRAFGLLPPGQLKWASGPFCWLMCDLTELSKPVPYKGALGLWRVPEALHLAFRTTPPVDDDAGFCDYCGGRAAPGKRECDACAASGLDDSFCGCGAEWLGLPARFVPERCPQCGAVVERRSRKEVRGE